MASDRERIKALEALGTDITNALDKTVHALDGLSVQFVDLKVKVEALCAAGVHADAVDEYAEMDHDDVVHVVGDPEDTTKAEGAPTDGA